MTINPFDGIDLKDVAAKAADICRRVPVHGYVPAGTPSGETAQLRAMYPPDAVRQALRALGRLDVENPITHAEPVSIWPEAEAEVEAQLPPDLLKQHEAQAQRIAASHHHH